MKKIDKIRKCCHGNLKLLSMDPILENFRCSIAKGKKSITLNLIIAYSIFITFININEKYFSLHLFTIPLH